MNSLTVLAIETSCDETSVAVLRYIKNSDQNGQFAVLSHITLSQASMHAEYGGVFPTMARREHEANIVSLIAEALDKAGLLQANTESQTDIFLNYLEREESLRPALTDFVRSHLSPDIDAIAVTSGPGLEPALWVGVNCAKSLSGYWNIPLIPVNHMEGHIYSVIISGATFDYTPFPMPALALLVSGGHTELVSINAIGSYTKIGTTRDDAVGEAFDKVARLLGLAYPGGPEISRLSAEFDAESIIPDSTAISLPRPMIHSGDLDFSFSGLKTAVRYLIEKLPKPLSDKITSQIAYEFESAVVDVLSRKTQQAIEKISARSLIIAGGVSANSSLRSVLTQTADEYSIPVYLPQLDVSGDNALMIAVVACLRISDPSYTPPELSSIKAHGNWSL